MLVPWSAFWDRNYFLQSWPAIQPVLTNNYVRGAVSGLGLLNVYAALAELSDVFSNRTL